jgi:hypothetical protein
MRLAAHPMTHEKASIREVCLTCNLERLFRDNPYLLCGAALIPESMKATTNYTNFTGPGIAFCLIRGIRFLFSEQSIVLFTW